MEGERPKGHTPTITSLILANENLQNDHRTIVSALSTPQQLQESLACLNMAGAKIQEAIWWVEKGMKGVQVIKPPDPPPKKKKKK